MTEAATIDPVVETAIKKIRAQGRFKIAAWTNTFARKETKSDDDLEHFGSPPTELKELFDYWIESSIIGYRSAHKLVLESILRSDPSSTQETRSALLRRMPAADGENSKRCCLLG